MAFTKVTGPGINSTSNYETNHINSTGIITATKFVGDGSTLTGISAGISLSGSTDNTVCTVTGANAIQGESNVRIDSSGRLLIGRTSSGYGGCVLAAQAPSGAAASLLLHRGGNASNADVLGILHFNDQNDYTGCQIRATASENWSASGHGSYLSFYTTDNTTTTNDERLRITSTGWQQGHADYQSVGINTFASWARTGGAIRAEVGYNAVTNDYMYFGTGTAHPLALRTGNTTALFIDNNQKVGIGVTPISIFHVRPLDETNFLVRNEGSTVVLASETNNGRDNNRLSLIHI